MRKRKQPPVTDILFVAMAGFIILMGVDFHRELTRLAS